MCVKYTNHTVTYCYVLCSLDEIREGAKAFHDVLEHDLPKLVKEKPKPTAPQAQTPCDRCGRDLYG